jgi:CBS domain-containing protein
MTVRAADETLITVEHLMTPDPIVIGESAPIDACVRMLEENEISGMPVVDADGLLVGVISETDVVRARATERLWSRWPGLRVRHLMHAPVLTADRQMGIEEAAILMERAHVHRLVVVDDSQVRPIGVISTSDLVRALARRPTDG